MLLAKKGWSFFRFLELTFIFYIASLNIWFIPYVISYFISSLLVYVHASLYIYRILSIMKHMWCRKMTLLLVLLMLSFCFCWRESTGTVLSGNFKKWQDKNRNVFWFISLYWLMYSSLGSGKVIWKTNLCIGPFDVYLFYLWISWISWPLQCNC